MWCYEGGGCGGGIAEVSRTDVEITSLILTFESVLDMFLMIFEVIPSSILDPEILTSGSVTRVFLGIEVITGSP